MLFYIFIFFIVGPIVEWGTHYLLHVTNNKIHLNHHKNITENSLDENHKITFEIWPVALLLILVYNSFYITSLLVLKYHIIHSLIHFYPELVPSLSNHHLTHHKYSKYNFCVTNIWPDILFGTKYH